RQARLRRRGAAGLSRLSSGRLMIPRVRVTGILVGVLALCLVAATDAGAKVAARSKGLNAVVGAKQWRLSLENGRGSTVLSEFPGTGAGPSGTLGFRDQDGVWHHATRVLKSRRKGGKYRATLATDDPQRKLDVRLEPDGAGVIELSAEIK